MTEPEITNVIAERENKLNETRKSLSILEVEYYRIKREMHKLESDKMDLGIEIKKAKLLIGEIQTEISQLTRKYYDGKGR